MKKKRNPKRAVQSERSSLLHAVPLLWHHVKANRPDLIQKAKGFSQGVKNMIIAVCPGKDANGKPLSLDKDLRMQQRDLYNKALDLTMKVEVNRANNNTDADELAIKKQAAVKDEEITAMIADMEKAMRENEK